MKLRIDIQKRMCVPLYAVQRRRWWGWEVILRADKLYTCEHFITQFATVREVEWIKK